MKDEILSVDAFTYVQAHTNTQANLYTNTLTRPHEYTYIDWMDDDNASLSVAAQSMAQNSTTRCVKARLNPLKAAAFHIKYCVLCVCLQERDGSHCMYIVKCA